MQAVNAAYEQAVELLRQRAEEPPVAPPQPAVPDPQPGSRPRRMAPHYRTLRDDASFTIDVLRRQAFEALVVVASWVGEVLVDDPPYVLEAFLTEPEPCWCAGFDLVPDAGGSTVSLTVGRGWKARRLMSTMCAMCG